MKFFRTYPTKTLSFWHRFSPFSFIISLLFIVSICDYSDASQIVTSTIWNNEDSVTAPKLNGNQNAITNVVNGNLDNTNMATGFKLFQVVATLPAPGNYGAVAFQTSDNTLNLDNGATWQATITPSGVLATGQIPYYNSGWQLLSPGAQYLPLISNGISSLPTYQTLTSQGGGTGSDLSASTQGSIPYFSTTGIMSALAPGTSGQFLQSQGASSNPQFSTVSWVPNNIQVFTASGTWTKPSGVSNVYVKVIGAGGAGGTANSGSTLVSGGGGGGGYAEGVIAVTGNVTVTIGSINSFAGSTTIQSTSGSVGVDNTGVGGAGGVGSNGTINLTGAAGETVIGISNGKGGNGGASAMGGGGSGARGGGGSGFNGANYGGGGGGGTNGGNGGSGDTGAVIVYY